MNISDLISGYQNAIGRQLPMASNPNMGGGSGFSGLSSIGSMSGSGFSPSGMSGFGLAGGSPSIANFLQSASMGAGMGGGMSGADMQAADEMHPLLRQLLGMGGGISPMMQMFGMGSNGGTGNIQQALMQLMSSSGGLQNMIRMQGGMAPSGGMATMGMSPNYR